MEDDLRNIINYINDEVVPDVRRNAEYLMQAMEKRGWQRLVGVKDGTHVVMVYVSKKARSPGDLKVCFAVTDGEHLVIGSARANLEPLAKLAGEQVESHLGRRAVAQLSAAVR